LKSRTKDQKHVWEGYLRKRKEEEARESRSKNSSNDESNESNEESLNSRMTSLEEPPSGEEPKSWSFYEE